jgi:hypothetical protein
MGIGTIIALVISVGIAFVLFSVLKQIAPLIINGVFGLVVYWLLSYLGILKVPLDILTFLIAALGGGIGVIIVVALSAFGIPL